MQFADGMRISIHIWGHSSQSEKGGCWLHVGATNAEVREGGSGRFTDRLNSICQKLQREFPNSSRRTKEAELRNKYQTFNVKDPAVRSKSAQGVTRWPEPAQAGKDRDEHRRATRRKWNSKTETTSYQSKTGNEWGGWQREGCWFPWDGYLINKVMDYTQST